MLPSENYEASIYRQLPAANPIRPLSQSIAPEITAIKFVFKEPVRAVETTRKKFQPMGEPPSEEFMQLLKKPLTSKKLIKQAFDWNFQSGNLLSVLRIQHNLFRLTLRPDTNSNHQSLWYYFRVRGLKSGRFILSPFRKKTSLYNQGMGVCYREQRGEWKRGGSNISYDQEGDHYILNFSFQSLDERIWTEMAYCIPYTCKQLSDYLNQNNILCQSLRKQSIASTFMKQSLFQITFREELLKPIILITGRVHSGETVSSHIVKGLLDTLLRKEPDTSQLLRHYQVRVIPMLNPDGVSMGNYRCSYSGYDLNRKWKDTHPIYHPEIYRVKKMVEMMKDRIAMVIDIHGHSRKKGVFFYGCSTSNDQSAKQFPYLMEKCYPQTFSFRKSCFRVQQNKEGTLRIHLWKKLKIPLVYTMECSFCGSETKDNFVAEDFERVGEELVKGITVYYSKNFEKSTVDLSDQRKKIIEKFLEEKDMLVNEEGDSGSDSEPSVGISDEPEIKTETRVPKSFQRKISFDTNRKQISPPKTSKRFQSVVKQFSRSQKSSPLKIKFGSNLISRSHVSSPKKEGIKDQKLSNKISTEYKIRLSKIMRETWNNKQQVLTGIRSQNEVNFSSEKYFPVNQHRKTEFSNFTSQLMFPNQIRETRPKGKQFFGAQYVRVKKQAEKMNLQKYNLPRPANTSMEHSNPAGKLRLQVRPLTSSKNIIKMDLYDQYF